MYKNIWDDIVHITVTILLPRIWIEACDNFYGGKDFFYRPLDVLGNGSLIFQFKTVQVVLDDFRCQGILEIKPLDLQQQ